MTEEQIQILRRELAKNTAKLQEELNDLQTVYNMPKKLKEQAKQNEVNKSLAEMRPVVGNGGTRGVGYSQSFYDEIV